MPYGNISVLHLRNVKANIVTVCCFSPLLSITQCWEMEKNAPGGLQTLLCYMLVSEVMSYGLVSFPRSSSFFQLTFAW